MADPLDQTWFREPSALDDSDDERREYESDSEGEEDLNPISVRGVNHESEPLREYGNTGVKGVLEDYREAKQKLIIRKEYEKERLYQQAKKNSFVVKSSLQEEEEEEREKEKEDISDIEDDDEFFKKYREKKLAEWYQQRKKKTFGEVKLISRNQFVGEIENEDPNVYVVIHLYEPNHDACDRLNDLLIDIADKYQSVKFLKAISYELKPDWDRFALPSLLIYKNGQYVNSVIRITHSLGVNFKQRDIENLLKDEGVV